MSRRVSRRAVLGSVVAGSAVLVAAERGAPSLPGGPGSASALAPAPVQQISAARLAADAAVAAHPTFRTAVYADVDAWMARLVELGVRRFRGFYDPANPGTELAIEACRRYGTEWIMLVVPEGGLVPTGQTPAETREIVRQIAATCPDVCAAIEGVNEPNHNRSTSVPPPPDWATRYAAPHQQAIWDTVRAEPALEGVEVIGSSLHDADALASYREDDPPGGPRHYDQLADAGLAAWQNRLGLHSYPDGHGPLAGLADRLEIIRSAFGDGVGVHLTETGYLTALGRPAGTRPGPVSEEAMATYVVRAALQFAALDLPWVWYELLDDPDPGAKDQVQANYGLWRADALDPGGWRPKPAAVALADFLETVVDTADDSAPAAAGENPAPPRLWTPPDAAVRCVVTTGGGRGSIAHLFRDVEVWDPERQEPLEVPAVPVELDGPSGRVRLTVGADVVSVPLS